jgi:2-keto-4-pentenoate hydratase/2-oxohepta-3-ene-1,7-dioic acid hydratase in catechol pathway
LIFNPSFIAIGLNYTDHAAESKMAIPAEPIVFMKSTTCIVGPYDNVMISRGAEKTDWEVELGIVIGARVTSIKPPLFRKSRIVWS